LKHVLTIVLQFLSILKVRSKKTPRFLTKEESLIEASLLTTVADWLHNLTFVLVTNLAQIKKNIQRIPYCMLLGFCIILLEGCTYMYM
jgi:hypothetical protein